MHDGVLLAIFVSNGLTSLSQEVLELLLEQDDFVLSHFNDLVNQELLFRYDLIIRYDLPYQGQQVDVSRWLKSNLMRNIDNLQHQCLQRSFLFIAVFCFSCFCNLILFFL